MHFDYTDGPNGPANWYKLKPEWAACAGKLQSPLAVDAKDMVTDPHSGQVNTKYSLNISNATVTKSDHDIVVSIV